MTLYFGKKEGHYPIDGGSMKMGVASVYQKHRSLLNWKMMYRDWGLPGAIK